MQSDLTLLLSSATAFVAGGTSAVVLLGRCDPPEESVAQDLRLDRLESVAAAAVGIGNTAAACLPEEAIAVLSACFTPLLILKNALNAAAIASNRFLRGCRADPLEATCETPPQRWYHPGCLLRPPGVSPALPAAAAWSVRASGRLDGFSSGRVGVLRGWLVPC